MRRFADILNEERNKFPYYIDCYPTNKISYYVTGEFREQKCKFAANDFQMCLNRMCFLSEYKMS